MRSELIQQYYDGPEYLAKLRAKISVMKEMEEDPYARAAKIMDIYSVDPIRFFEDFLLIKVTKHDGSAKPFFLFDYQKKIILKLQEIENSNGDIEFLMDKPREMGITWIICGYFLWRFLFTPNYSAFILSRSEGEVDDGTRTADGSIFGKIRWMLDRLPKYMIPNSYQKKVARGTTTDMVLKLINPDIGSALVGSSTNANAGRSRRYTTTFIDECFAIERFSEVYRALQSVSKLKIFASTVKQGRVFEDFKKLCEVNGNYLSLKWSDHPFKDKIWYDEQVKKAEIDPDVMKEIEADYSVNIRAQYYPEIRQSKVEPVEYDPMKPLWVSLDFGIQDLTVLEWWQYDGMSFKCLDAYFNRNKPAEWYAPFLNPEAAWNSDFYNQYQQDFIMMKTKKWKKPSAYFGELDHIKKMMPLNMSVQDILAKHGIRLIYNPYAIEHEPRRNATTRILPRTIFNRNSDGAMRVYDGLMQSRYSNVVRTTTEQKKPIHDPEIADFRAAAENFFVNVPRLLRTQRDDIVVPESKSFAGAIMRSLKG